MNGIINKHDITQFRNTLVITALILTLHLLSTVSVGRYKIARVYVHPFVSKRMFRNSFELER